MSPIVYGCVICGFPVESSVNETEPWVGEFRIVYCRRKELVHLTGVGHYSYAFDADYSAPCDHTKRWDDEGFVDTPPDKVSVMLHFSEERGHAFLLHNACWHLLRKYLEPLPIPLDRLYDICRSLPYPLRGIGICWGHGYGGLLPFDKQDHYPWEDSLMNPSVNSQAFQCAENNPYDVSGATDLLDQSHEISQDGFVKGIEYGQGLTKLPWEIIEMVAKLLPITDARNLCHSSKRLAHLWTSQGFWASRFRHPHERNFFFESWNSRVKRDWHALHRATGPFNTLPGLHNRKRIWNLLRDIADLLDLRLAQSSMTAQMTANNSERDKVVSGDLSKGVLDRATFREGCTLLYRQRASISQGLCKISVAIVRVGNLEYVTGLRIIGCNDEVIHLGYISKDIEPCFETTELRGFIVAVGARGVRGLRIVGSQERFSQWYGCPEDTPLTERLANIGSVDTLEVGLDGFKMVSLAVTGLDQPDTSLALDQESPLHSLALWYPEFPPKYLCLNGDSFTGEWPSDDVYQPLSWVSFGGQNGVCLSSLISVSVTTLGSIVSIQFKYSMDTITSCKLGRRKFTDFSRVDHFAIDGPGGERIDSVAVSIEKLSGEGTFTFYRHGKLSTLELTTNWGRSVHFGATESSNPPRTHALSISPGTSITGFYAGQVGLNYPFYE